MDAPFDPHDYNQERKMKKHLLKMRRRNLRDAADPFNVTYEAFIKSYRLHQDLVFSLLELIHPFMKRTTSPLAVPLELKVLAVLSFYATGSYQRPTGRHFDCPIGQSTLSGFIEEVTNALNEDEVLGRLVRFPSNNFEINICIERNRALGGKIPDTVGYTDGSLFKVKKPSVENNRQAFMGRKNYACINAQITCDKRLYIMNVLARYPGATADSFIFEGSALRRRMVQAYQTRPCHLLGDEGYVLEPWMIIPFGDPEEESPESRFNKCHCSDRNSVERAIGALKERFRFLNDGRVPHYDYFKVCKFVNAGAVLHNLCVLTKTPLDVDDVLLRNNIVNEARPEELEESDGEDDDEEPEDPDLDVPIGRRNAAAVIARGHQVRRQIVEELERRHH
ncbi:Putative nuclease [Frankliniella fusca]|uniref:Nuclease n=1 Tax=Frankliniella fusca TaxID=407009 RepID=A0AAE1HNG5_9NEOP|nr:Putative nuclease [Frankliniella fusca]